MRVILVLYYRAKTLWASVGASRLITSGSHSRPSALFRPHQTFDEQVLKRVEIFPFESAINLIGTGISSHVPIIGNADTQPIHFQEFIRERKNMATVSKSTVLSFSGLAPLRKTR